MVVVKVKIIRKQVKKTQDHQHHHLHQNQARRKTPQHQKVQKRKHQEEKVLQHCKNRKVVLKLDQRNIKIKKVVVTIV